MYLDWPVANSIGWTDVTSAVNIAWIWCRSTHKRRTALSSIWSKRMTYHTSGHRVVCAISKDAKVAPIWNQRISTAGSGHRHAKRSNKQTEYHSAGPTTHGARLDTRNYRNQTMLNTTSIRPANRACPYLTMSTKMVSHGTTLHAITKNQWSAKIQKNFWTMLQLPTEEFVFKS